MRMMTHGKAAANRGRCGGFFPGRSLSSCVRGSSSRYANRGLERSALTRVRPDHTTIFVAQKSRILLTRRSSRRGWKGVAAAVRHGTWFAKTYAGVRQS
jgi:hypothetical protein